MDLSIVIPCYNEAEVIPKLQQELGSVVAELTKTRSIEVIFVDDGSTDQTGSILAQTFNTNDSIGSPYRLARHESNKGLGAAIRTGFAAARGQVIVTTDCDGTYHFSEIPKLLSCLKPGVDLVTASPYHPAGGVENVPEHRLILSRGSSAIYRLLANRQIHTYTALFRAYRRSVIKAVPFQSDGFLAGTELLVNSMFLGFQIAEYPTILHARVFGTSKAKLARTISAHLRFQAHVLRSQLRVRQRFTAPLLSGFSTGFREIIY